MRSGHPKAQKREAAVAPASRCGRPPPAAPASPRRRGADAHRRRIGRGNLKVADTYLSAAILIRGDLTAWKHERSVQAATDRDCGDELGPEYYRADGAIRAINYLAEKAEQKRSKFQELALVAAYGDLDELARARAALA